MVNETTWWLMDCALPNLNWARMRVFADGTADVLDSDGRLHEFHSAADARDWLSEDELIRASSLEPDELAAYVLETEDIAPPPEGISDAELVPRMSQQIWGASLREDIAATAFSAPWMRVAADDRRALEQALAEDLRPDHSLFGREARAVGRHAGRGEVVFLVDSPPELAIVELSSSSSFRQAPLLRTTHPSTFDDFLNRMLRDEAEAKAG